MKKIISLFKNKKQQSITIVSGLPRSGTSMMMKMLEAGGLTPLVDNLRTADEDNPKGYYELERVKKLPDGDTEWLGDAQDKVVKIISGLLFHLPDNYEYRILFMRRKISEVIASQRKMIIRRGEDPDKVSEEELNSLFQKHLNQVKNWIESKKNVHCLEVDYNQIMTEPGPVIEEINSFLANRLLSKNMFKVIDPLLHRQRF